MTAPRLSASVVVTDAEGRVLVGRRRPSLRFMGGFVAFPGGVVDAETDGDDHLAPSRAAHRELWEETGLVARGARLVYSSEPPEDPFPGSTIVRFTTPDWYPIRFETWFFHLVVEDSDAPAKTDEDMEEIRFEAPDQLLERWKSLDYLIAPPTRRVLEALATLEDHRDSGTLAESLIDDDPRLAEEFEPMSGIQGLPLKTPTLPPATHTNCYLIGHEKLLVIDPATYDHDERQRLLRVIERLSLPVEAVFLSHHHEDHIGSARWLSEQLNVPVWAHPKTAELVKDALTVDRTFEDGDVLDLGSDAIGKKFELELLHTPGHAAGHIVFVDRRRNDRRSMIVGDMVASTGTIIVDPDDGSMREYVEQLVRMRDLAPGVLFPSHGPPIYDGVAKLEAYLEHRKMREEKVLAAVKTHGPINARALVPHAYDDTPEKAWPLAERSLLAHLEKLVDEGRVTRDGAMFEA
jgi:glyoxylase-like metal-dependent hydrolase (beta-lactamase superfamily II)/8-oxo-dGTP pyrophosphatase MutT (NUDIX family)